MSGLEFMPAWVAPLVPSWHGNGAGNIFTDQKVIEAEKLLLRRITETVGKHRRFLGFDLGNELGVLQGLNNPVTPDQADAWATQLLHYCEEIAPGKFHVNGVDDVHWFSDFGFSRENLATVGKATVVHCYVFFTGALSATNTPMPARCAWRSTWWSWRTLITPISNGGFGWKRPARAPSGCPPTTCRSSWSEW